jgi:hypothetical protein
MVSSYTKKVSSEEARCGFILILKNKRSMFPPSGRRFNLCFRGSRLPVVVDEIPCACVGSDKPHVHYHLHVPVGLSRGDIVRIMRREDDFLLEVKQVIG